MPKGEGKGWKKGRTAASDPRVERAAAAHTGKRYVRRKPLSEMKWARAIYTTLPIEWSAEMAYIVGLTATDGCLASAMAVRGPAAACLQRKRSVWDNYVGRHPDWIREVPTTIYA